MSLNRIKDHLASKRKFVGAALTFGSTRVTEVMARSGFDFLMVDLQHGDFHKSSATDSIRAIAAAGCVPFARVAENTPGAINDLLDAGALGIVVPMVNSKADATAAVKAAFYPPRGMRSKGGMAPTLYGDDYPLRANESVMITIMIETAAAVDAVDEIMSADGLNLCLVGTSDLAFEMGAARNSEEIHLALRRVVESGERHGVPVGIAIASPGDIALLHDLNASFFLVSHDYGILRSAAAKLGDELAKALEHG
jgi:4-hydroxy-2-oxoheptanedioate aldolase